MDSDDRSGKGLITWGSMIVGAGLAIYSLIGLVSRRIVAHGDGGVAFELGGDDALAYSILILIVGVVLLAWGMSEWFDSRA